MLRNTFGHLLRLTSFGESHGSAIGGVIDGFPAGVEISLEAVQIDLDRRKPGQSKITTQRKESDRVEFLSGIFEGKSLGTPIGFLIKNEDAKSKDYSQVKDVYGPSHADYTYDAKFGQRDYRGGGRSSARETACRVVAGSLAKQFLKHHSISIIAFVDQVGPLKLDKPYSELDLEKTEESIVRCPDQAKAQEFIELIERIKKEGDTVGGTIQCVIKGVPAGVGEPVFSKLHADLALAMMGINAVKGFEYGSGFEGVERKGSEENDAFTKDFETKSNNSGGIQGGISNGQDIYFRIGFKPVATLMQEQSSINQEGQEVQLKMKGRHDPCVVPRAVPIVESMAALVIADHLLLSKTNKI